MLKETLAAGVLIASMGSALADELRIGFITTLSGGGALLGKAQLDGLKLGLEAHGWLRDGDKLAGVPMRLFIADDQQKTDTGLAITQRLIGAQKVQVIAGHIWSNVLMSVVPAVAQANRILIGTNAGPAPLAGAQCSRNFVSTALQNDEAAEAMGLLMNQDQVTNVYLIAPNYQAGKDYLAGFQRTFNGRVIDQALVKLGETDFQADLSRIRASSPEAVFGFLPGAMGIAFAKQWSASGMSERVKLYTVYTIDNLTLPAIGKAAVGTYHTNIWNPDSQNPRNLEFVKRFTAKHGRAPSMFAVTTYDAVTLIVDAVKAVGGNVDDTTALMRAMRTGGLRSIRGDLKYNVNGFLVQPYYSREVVLSPQGAPTIRGKQQVMFKKDSYGESCPAAQRWE